MSVSGVVGGFSTCRSFQAGRDREAQRARLRLRERMWWSARASATDPKSVLRRINGALGAMARPPLWR
jgi:hypothetical protein